MWATVMRAGTSLQQSPRRSASLQRLTRQPSINPLGKFFDIAGGNQKPGGVHFYNDEMTSHLHGYVFLAGGIPAHDEVRIPVFRRFQLVSLSDLCVF